MGCEICDFQSIAELDRLVDFENAERDAVEVSEPNWILFGSDFDYRRRYVTALVGKSLLSVPMGVLVQVVRLLLAARKSECVELVGCKEF